MIDENINENFFEKASTLYHTMIKNNKEQFLRKSEKIFAENFHIFIICLFDLKRVISGIDYLELFTDNQSEKEEKEEKEDSESGYEVMIVEDKKVIEKERKFEIYEDGSAVEEETIIVSSRRVKRKASKQIEEE